MATRRLTQTKKFNGKTYSLWDCKGTKREATKKADGLKSQGYNARVIQVETGRHCIYKAGRKKSK